MRAFQQWSLVAVVALLFGVAPVLAQPATFSDALYTESRPAMGTVFTMECYAPDADSADRIMEAAFDEIDRVEGLHRGTDMQTGTTWDVSGE